MAEKIKAPGVSGTWNYDDIRADMVDKLDAAFKDFAQDIAGEAKTTAQEHDHTGTLKKGIVVKRSKFHKKLGWIVLSKGAHSQLFEYGSKDRYTSAGAFRGRMPRLGLIWPAVDKFKKAHLQKLKGLLD